MILLKKNNLKKLKKLKITMLQKLFQIMAIMDQIVVYLCIKLNICTDQYYIFEIHQNSNFMVPSHPVLLGLIPFKACFKIVLFCSLAFQKQSSDYYISCIQNYLNWAEICHYWNVVSFKKIIFNIGLHETGKALRGCKQMTSRK